MDEQTYRNTLWWQAYLAALTGLCANPDIGDHAAPQIAERIASQAVAGIVSAHMTIQLEKS